MANWNDILNQVITAAVEGKQLINKWQWRQKMA